MEDLSTVRRPSHRWLRRIVATMFLLTLATLGFRTGYQRGYEPEGIVAQSASNSLIRKVYPVADLVTPIENSGATAPDFDSLIDLIVATIERESWMENGAGEGEIQPFLTNKVLVVSQTQRIHGQISDLLEQLRRLQDEVTAEQAISLFQSWAAYGKEQSHGFQEFPANAEGRRAINQYFAKSLQNVIDAWGPPTFHGKRDGTNFPKWSSAEELAWWPRGKGMAYLSIEPKGESRPQLVLGWRPGTPPPATGLTAEPPSGSPSE
jgi:hypothetical protein